MIEFLLSLRNQGHSGNTYHIPFVYLRNMSLKTLSFHCTGQASTDENYTIFSLLFSCLSPSHFHLNSYHTILKIKLGRLHLPLKATRFPSLGKSLLSQISRKIYFFFSSFGSHSILNYSYYSKPPPLITSSNYEISFLF